MMLNQFIDDVQNDITVDGQLPFTVPKQTIIRSIKNAKKWFYKNYEYASEDGYIYIDLNKQGFVCDNYIQLPDNIISVYGVHPTRTNLHGDFSIERITLEDFYNKRTGVSGTNMLEYYVINQIHLQQLKTIFEKRMSFDFNPNTHRLFIKGWKPTNGNIILQAYTAIEDDSLFSDDYFFRYVVAQCKVLLARVMGTVTMQLVGNAQIDFSLIKDEGVDDLDKVKEEIKKREGVDYFLVQ